MFTPVLPPTDESTWDNSVVGIFIKFRPLLYKLAAKPVTSPVIPPPIEITQSCLEKFLLSKIRKILKIFENKGEQYFREIEENITLKYLKKKKIVISLGGGAFLNNIIKKEVLDNHISFWLNWDVKTLVNRIKDSKKRPIAHRSTKNEIEELIKKRSIIYSKALYKINCENFTKSEIVKKIIEIYEAH